MATFHAPTVKTIGTPKYSPPKLPKPVPMGLGGRLKMPGVPAPGPTSPAPAAASAPPPASTPAAAAGPAALPPDATYEQILGALQRKRDTTLSQLAGDRTRTLLDYGFNENAATGALSYDPNNPESKAAQLKKHYDQSRSGTGITMAAQGQLYAGSYQNAQDSLNRNQLSSEDQLSKALTNYLSGNTSAKTGAQTDYELGAGQAYGDRVARAPANPLYSPTPDQADGAAAPAAAAGPAMYSGPKGLVNGQYIDKDGGIHAVQTKGGKKYYLAGSGKWVPI